MSATVAVVTVPGISCGHCADAISAEVSKLDGVESVAVDVEEKTVRIVGDVLPEDIEAAIDEAGYEVSQ